MENVKDVDYFTTECEKCHNDMDFIDDFPEDNERSEVWRCFDCKIDHVITFLFKKMVIVKNE